MVNIFQIFWKKYSEISYSVIFVLGFFVGLNNYSDDSNESFIWLLVTIICFFLSSYYITILFSKFMDKFEGISLFREIKKPINPSTLGIAYIIAISLNVLISWINSTSIEIFSEHFANGLFIIQIVLLVAITNDLSHYLSRASTVKTVAYGGGSVFQGPDKGITVEESQGFFKKNLLILLNILNFCLFIYSSIVFS